MQLRRGRNGTGSRVAIALVFALHGAMAGSFFTRVPWLRDQLGLSPAMLGFALVFPSIGAIAAMPLAGRTVHRLGGRAAVRILLALFFVVGAVTMVAPALPLLCLALLAAGASAGMADVAMNGNGVAVEEQLGRPIMSGLHGAWSVGALAGSAVGAVAAAAGLDARIHLAGMAALLLILAGAAGGHLLDVRPDAGAEPPPRFALPPRAVLPIGLVGLCAIFAEAASNGWSGVYLRDVAGASAGVAAASYTAFAGTMAVARLVGDAVVGRFGPVRTVRGAGALAALGGLLVVSARTPLPAVAGFALLGIGVAVVVPLAFATAGRRGPNPSQAIAGVATITYVASLAAPAAIGGLAGATSLPVSFAAVTALVAALVLGAGALRQPEQDTGSAVREPDSGSADPAPDTGSADPAPEQETGSAAPAPAAPAASHQRA